MMAKSLGPTTAIHPITINNPAMVSKGTNPINRMTAEDINLQLNDQLVVHLLHLLDLVSGAKATTGSEIASSHLNNRLLT